MTNIITSLAGIAYWVFMIYSVIRGKFKFAIPMIIFVIMYYPLLLGILLQYSFNEKYDVEQNSIFISYANALVLFVMFLVSFFLKSTRAIEQTSTTSSKKKWVLLLTGYFVYVVALIITLAFWYSSNLYIDDNPNMLAGVLTYNVGVIIASTILYLSLKYKSYERPNLIGKIISLSILIIIQHLSLALSLILLYASPPDCLKIYPFEASLNMTSSIFLVGLLLLVKKNAINDNARNNDNNTSVNHTLNTDSLKLAD